VNQPTGKFWKEREINNIDTEKNHRERRKKNTTKQTPHDDEDGRRDGPLRSSLKRQQ
jgi:hypothetical protein